MSKVSLWRDVDETTLDRAIDELLEKEFTRENMREVPGCFLTESGADHPKNHE